MSRKNRVFNKKMAIIGAVLLALVLAGTILNLMGYGKILWHNMKFWRPNDINYKLSYTVNNTKAEKKKNVVVATYGNQSLTNGELQGHYWSEVYAYISAHSDYVASAGLDLTKPLNEQYYEDTDKTYQQWFLEQALEKWYQHATLKQMAEDAGFRMSAAEQAGLDNFAAEIQSEMAEYQYTDAEKFIDEHFYPGSSYELYLKYNRMQYTAAIYYNYLYTGVNPTQGDLETYYNNHEAEFVANKIDKSVGDYYDVRHVLVGVEGGQWEACLETARNMLDEFLTNAPTEEKFAQIAMQYSADAASAGNGGLHTDLTMDADFCADFVAWYTDESRQVGDTGLVKEDTQGYHIMYFSGGEPIWQREAREAMMKDYINGKLAEAQAKHTLTIDYKKIVLSTVSLTD